MLAESYSECRQTSKMELFVKMISNLRSFNVLAKKTILDVSQGSV